MRVRYQFAVRSEIQVTSGSWPNLSFEGGDMHVEIEKPIPRSNFYTSADLLDRASDRKVDPEAAWAAYLGVSLIAVELEQEEQVQEDKISMAFYKPAMEVLSGLLPWVRVLTRQYWVGYKELSSVTVHALVTVINKSDKKSLGTVTVPKGFIYGKDLDQNTWLAIGTKLANRERPRPSELFFCDALIDIAEGDIPQAVVALGASCDIEIHILVQDILRRRSEEFQNIFKKYARYTFGQGIDALVRDFGGDPFTVIEPEAARLVKVLYSMRGNAIHRAECIYEQQGKRVPVDSTNIGLFVEATEKLFTWSESQRSKSL